MSQQHRGDRILALYLRMRDGESIRKMNYTLEEGVTPRTFDRDIQTLRNCMSEHYLREEICYDKVRDAYYMTNHSGARELSLVEGYLLVKALLQDRILRDDEIAGLADSVISMTRGSERKQLQELVQGDILRYISPDHGQAIMKLTDDLLLMIRRRQKIRLRYGSGSKQSEIEVLPLALEHGAHELYFLFATKAGDRGALLEVPKIHSFQPLSDYFNMDERMEQMQKEMRCAVQKEQVGKYKIEEMVTHGTP